MRIPSRITTSLLSTMRWTTWTPSRTWTCTTRITEHTARRPLMHSVHIAPCGSSPPCTRHPIHACAPVCCVLVVSPRLSCPLLRPTVLLPAHSWCSPQRSTRGPGPTPCATSAWGPWSLLTTRHPLTGYEPKKDLNFVNTEELDLAATSDVYWQHTFGDDASLNDPDVDDNQLAKYLAVLVDSTGKPVEMRSKNDLFSLWHSKLEKCSESVSFGHSSRNDLSNWGVCSSKNRWRARKRSCTD